MLEKKNNQVIGDKPKVIILAGGNGNRMKGNVPKILIPINGIPIIKRVVNCLEETNLFKEIIVVYNPKYTNDIKKTIANVTLIPQEIALGTASAVQCALPCLLDNESVMIMNADFPLIDSMIITEIVKRYQYHYHQAYLIGVRKNNPHGYGRIKMSGYQVSEIIEEKDATVEERDINFVNIGIYFFNSSLLKKYLHKIQKSSISNEYYLTEIFKLIYQNELEGAYAGEIAYTTKIEGANSQEELQQLLN